MHITVYLGANCGNLAMYKKETEKLGQWLAQKKHTLVYGAGNIGLMGILANTVLANGGEVIGIIPNFLMEKEMGHHDLTTLILVNDMSERKKKLFEMGEAFIAMPGGAGTLEEICDVISWSRLGQNPHPCILYNLHGFYDPLKYMYEKMVEEGFLEQKYVDKILFSADLDEIEAFIKNYEAPEVREFTK